MKAASTMLLLLSAVAAHGLGTDEILDRVDAALTAAAPAQNFRIRLSGAVDLEEYQFQAPAPALIFSDGRDLFNPRLTLFLDAQWGPHLYLFAQARADRAFDPNEEGAQFRMEEYALRFAPGERSHLSLQIGKFATVVGNWVERHDSWSNPFITAPLPYENSTGIWDRRAAGSVPMLLSWAHVPPANALGVDYEEKYRRVPIIWGPSYGSGAAVFGRSGPIDYAVEMKNTSLSSRPETWDVAQAQWQHPTFSGRVGYRPDEMWTFGFSASTGSYLRSIAQSTLASGRSLDDYREILLGQDLAFAWHHVQLWAEVFETRFAIPRVGNADTAAYYFEAKYKFTPQFFGALRWNQQLFGTLPDGRAGDVPWGRDIWRIDVAPTYRLTAHTQFKLQYSLQHETFSAREYDHLLAAQFTLRF